MMLRIYKSKMFETFYRTAMHQSLTFKINHLSTNKKIYKLLKLFTGLFYKSLFKETDILSISFCDKESTLQSRETKRISIRYVKYLFCLVYIVKPSNVCDLILICLN